MPRWLPVSQLLLDDQNYRFPEDALGTSQDELLKRLDRDFDLLPIGRSMARNGYFVEEPLVTIPGLGDTHVVVEGNRRLAALKLLLDQELRNLSLDKDEWNTLAKQVVGDLSQVPVVVYEKRDSIRASLGFRHLAGPLRWQPLAQARYINRIAEEKGKDASFADIARETPHWPRTDFVQGRYIAYRAYLQARDDFKIDTSELEEEFSVFYRAVTVYAKIVQFIGISRDGTPQELREPVPPDRADELKELIGFVHGTHGVSPAIRDSRQLDDLAEVLASQEGLETLRRYRDVDRAKELIGGKTGRLVHNLSEACFHLNEATRDAPEHAGDPDIVALVLRCATAFQEIAGSFPQITVHVERQE